MDKRLQFPILRQLVWRDIWLNRSSTLVFLGVLTGILLMAGIINAYSNKGFGDVREWHLTWYGILFFLVGIFQTAGVYREFKRPATLQDYLLLPASHLEKWISRWLRSLPMYLILFTTVYTLAAAIMNVAVYLTHHNWLPFFHPFDPEIMRFWLWFVPLHALFLVGAVHFNRNATLKTILILFGVLVIYGSITGGFQQLLFRSVMQDEHHYFMDPEDLFGFDPETWLPVLKKGLKVFLFAVIVPFLWWVSFLKLNEKEV